MGKKVSNLKVQKQKGTDNTYFASWEFAEPKVYKSSGSIVKGSIVNFVKSAVVGGAVSFSNGAPVSEAVKSDTWKVMSVNGPYAILGDNTAGTKRLNSSVPLKNLVNATTKKESVIPVANTDHYNVHWYYSSGNGTWFDGGASDVTLKNATYSPPDNAISMKCVVKPVSKTYTETVKVSNSTKTVTKSYWSGEAVSVIKMVEGVDTPEKLSAPSVEIDTYKLTATIENISDSKCDQVEFYIVKDKKSYKTVKTTVREARAKIQITVDGGGVYDVKCRAINVIATKTSLGSIFGDWSEWTYDVKSAPSKIKKILKVKALTETSAYISWEAVPNAEKYKVEYAEKKDYFNGSGSVGSIEVTTTHAEITGMTTGMRYYFRVCAAIGDQESKWTTGTYSVVLGTKPSAPSTWSNKTVLGTNEAIKLYWIQNSEDGSDQTHAQLTMSINGEKQPTISLDKYIGKDETNSVYTIPAGTYNDDTKISWAIRTAGVTGEYGDWSITREISIYTTPTISVSIEDMSDDESGTITNYPIVIDGSSQPDTQRLISYSMQVMSVDTYETTDDMGNFKMVYANESVFNKYYVSDSNEFQVSLNPQDINLEYGYRYKLQCVASFDSGLTSTAELEFYVEWSTNDEYVPNATIVIDSDSVTAVITPYCTDSNDELSTNVTLSVYRKEFDGAYVLIESDVENSGSASVVDPHPALDDAKYRIVAIDQNNGKVSYTDVSEPVGEIAAIIQWDEKWDSYDASDGNGDALAEPVLSGKRLRLMYNIDISDSFSPDAELLEYAGREHPVSYYGTQIGHTSTWSVDIVRDDKATLALIRELARYKNDVYVREPSGTGYWAQVTVSYTQTHCELIIPVQFSITRVEGGI